MDDIIFLRKQVADIHIKAPCYYVLQNYIKNLRFKILDSLFIYFYLFE